MATPQASRFALYLRRMFSIRETMADINLLQDFFPTVELAGDVMPDLRRARGEQNLIATINGTVPGAGLFRRCWLGNLPPFSLFCIQDLYVQLTGSSNLDVGFAVTQPTGGFTLRFQRSDAREPTNTGNAMVQGATDTGTPATNLIFGFSAVGNAFVFKGINIVLTSQAVDGTARSLVVSAETANIGVSVIAVGYEKVLEPSETIA